MFSKFRFVLVSDADQFDEDETKAFGDYMKNPSPLDLPCHGGANLGPVEKAPKTD